MWWQYVIVAIVAPLAGAWIEMIDDLETAPFEIVAPLAGAWIEIMTTVAATWRL